MTRSPEEIEAEVEATRSELDRTVEAIKDKMSPGQLLDELVGALKGTGAGSGASQMAVNLGNQVRDNPLPVALIGAGLAWLAISRNQAHQASRPRSLRSQPAYALEPDFDDSELQDLAGGDGSSQGDGLAAKAQAAKSRVAEAARSAGDAVAGAASSVKQTVSQAASRVGQQGRQMGAQVGGSGMTRQAADIGRRMQSSLLDSLDEEPLLIGAFGLAIGAALGASLPATPVENRYVGPLRDKVLDRGRDLAQQGLQQAKEAGSAALDRVKEEAERQGVTGEPNLVQRAEQIARAGADALREQADQRLPH